MAFGLVDMQARMYSPLFGRFLSPDTVIDGGYEDPQGLNRYSYVKGHVMSANDPTGHQCGATSTPSPGSSSYCGGGSGSSGGSSGSGTSSSGYSYSSQAPQPIPPSRQLPAAGQSSASMQPQVAKIKSENPSYVVTQPQTVYRAIKESPLELESTNFKAMTPRGTSTDLRTHQLDSKIPPSNYVSTAQTPQGAALVNPNGYLYTIQKTQGFDVNASLGKTSVYPREVEIAVPYSISPSQIVGVQTVSGGVLGPYTPLNFNAP